MGQYGSAQSRQRGTPPKGYKKSDDRVREDVCERVMDEGIDCRNVDISVKDGLVTLTGEVCHRADKYRLEHLAADIAGVSDVENQLRLTKKTAGGESSATESKTDRTSTNSDGYDSFRTASSVGAKPSDKETSLGSATSISATSKSKY